MNSTVSHLLVLIIAFYIGLFVAVKVPNAASTLTLGAA